MTPLDVQTQQPPPEAATQTIGRGPAVLVQWDAPEYQVQKKTTAWYVVFGVVVALLLFSAVLTRSFLSGIVFGLLAFLVLLYSERPPRTARFQLTPDALIINDRRYPFSQLDAFNIVESPSGRLLLLRSRRLVMPLIHVPLGEQESDLIRPFVQDALREDPDLREPLADLLAHRLGF